MAETVRFRRSSEHGYYRSVCIDPKELSIAALMGQIIVFDRVRLLSAARQGNVQLDDAFKAEVTDWLQPRIDGLPRVA
jgi:hypothetical protein